MIETISQNIAKEVYVPTTEEREFVMKVYGDYLLDYQIKNQSWKFLNDRTLEHFWEDCNYDYNVLVNDDPSDPVTAYSSGITRDKANGFISNLTLQLLLPSITAQNPNQEIDQTVSKVGRSILGWQFDNDGRPAESGIQKNSRYTHKQVVEGTVHIQDDIDPKTGKLVSTNIPNEEVFVPNFFQPNLQLQSHFLRVQEFASFQELKTEFGHLKNFEYVNPGSYGWMNEILREKYKGVDNQNQATAFRLWYPVPEKELEILIKSGKLPKETKRAKYFNIIINGVLMFPVDNLMPYYHGYFPVSKGVFEYFSPSEYYWGNSMPNKCRQDKKFYDGWKTLIRYKAKLAAIPALVNATGQHIDSDILIPGNVTDLPAGTDMKQFGPIAGISQGISNGDIQILTDAVSDIERATASSQTVGQQNSGRQQTARETIVIEQNAQKAMMGLAQQIAFLQEARVYPVLKSSFQFLTRQDIKKISIPDQVSPDGKSGTLEVIFDKIPQMSKEEVLNASYKIKKQEEEKGSKIVYLDMEYIQNLDFYGKATAESLPAETSAIREARAEQKFTLYASRPDVFNVKAAARKLVRENGDNEEMINNEPPPNQPQPGEQPEGGLNAKVLKPATQQLKTSMAI